MLFSSVLIILLLITSSSLLLSSSFTFGEVVRMSERKEGER
jgi:hypothetical protein